MLNLPDALSKGVSRLQRACAPDAKLDEHWAGCRFVVVPVCVPERGSRGG
jgi:hypothetical protein